MKHKTHPSITRWFFLLLLVGVLYLFWEMISPFILAIVTAGIFAVILSPFNKKLQEKTKWNFVSPLVLTLAVFLGVFLPVLVIGVFIVQQASEIVTTSLHDTSWLSVFSLTDNAFFQSLPAIVQEKILTINVASMAQYIAQWMATNIGSFASKSFQFLFNTFIFFLALFNMLLYREEIHQFLLEMSPFKDKIDEEVIVRIVRTIRSVVFGALIISIVQAVLASLGLTIFGVPGALLWGSLVLIAAQIPSIGVGLVMIPSIAYLAATGQMFEAVGLTIWSIFVVGLVDNFLSPVILGAKTKMPEFLILLSVLGGLQVFGPIGFILGPTILALLMVLIELYKKGILEE